MLELYGEDLQGKKVCHRTVNRNTGIIMSVGSQVPDIHKLCRELHILLSVEWVSRNDNSTANELSRVENATDHMLDP